MVGSWMSVIIPLYLALGILWAAAMFRHHHAIIELRRLIGDYRTVLLMPIIVLLWPIELSYAAARVVGLLWYRFWRGLKDHRNRVDFSEFGMVCHSCQRSQPWLGSDEAMREAGWRMTRNPYDQTDVYWFCPDCESVEPPPVILVCSICGRSQPWSGSLDAMASLGWRCGLGAEEYIWLCPFCAEEGGSQ